MTIKAQEGAVGSMVGFERNKSMGNRVLVGYLWHGLKG